MSLRSLLALHLASQHGDSGKGGPCLCLSFSTCGSGHRVGHEVPSNGVLNGHPSFSVDSYALRANQLECLRDSWERGKYL